MLSHNFEGHQNINRYSSEGLNYEKSYQKVKKLRLSKLLKIESRVNEAKILNAYS